MLYWLQPINEQFVDLNKKTVTLISGNGHARQFDSNFS